MESFLRKRVDEGVSLRYGTKRDTDLLEGQERGSTRTCIDRKARSRGTFSSSGNRSLLQRELYPRKGAGVPRIPLSAMRWKSRP
jgi:hypothetical protein